MSMEVAEDPDQMVVQEYPPFVRIYKSGRVERLKGNDVVPASVESTFGVSSKDVAISGDVSARLFLPNNNVADPSEEKKKLPVLLYVHGGGFVIETPFSPTYHAYVGSLAAAAGIVAVSVHYRRAPEHPLPAAYDDAWAALKWVASHAGGAGPEPWLVDHADCSKVFLAGDSAGGNIVHDLLLRTGEGEGGGGGAVAAHPPVGAVLIHPYFWGARPADAPPGTGPTDLWAGMEKFWKFVCPSTTGEDDPLTNPHVGGLAGFARLAGKRVLVCLAEKDFLTVWGRMYCEALGSSGFRGTVEMLVSEGEGHVFHLFDPECQKAKEMMSRVVEFINRDD